MKNTPLLLSDTMMPLYRGGLVFSFMLGIATLFIAVGYGVFLSSFTAGLILFLKGMSISATITIISFLALWKKYQFQFEECQRTNGKYCNNMSFFNYA